MNEKFIPNLIEDFFETGVLECSIFQLNSVYEFTKNKVKELEENHKNSVEHSVWLNFYRMILTYTTETSITINKSNKDTKVSFKGYLLKVYGISEGELDEPARDILYEKYRNFIKDSCCNNCLFLDVHTICSKCPCGEVYSCEANN